MRQGEVVVKLGHVSEVAIKLLASSDFDSLMTVNLLTREGRAKAVDIGKRHGLFYEGQVPSDPAEENLDPITTFLKWRNDWEKCCKIQWSPIEGNNRLLAWWYILHQMIAQSNHTVKLRSAGDQLYLTNQHLLGENTIEPNSGAMEATVNALSHDPTNHPLTKAMYQMKVLVLSNSNETILSSEVTEQRLRTVSSKIATDKRECSTETVAGQLGRSTPIFEGARDRNRNSLRLHLIVSNAYMLVDIPSGDSQKSPWKMLSTEPSAQTSIGNNLLKYIKDPATELSGLNDTIKARSTTNNIAEALLPVFYDQPITCTYITKTSKGGVAAFDVFSATTFPFYYQLLCNSQLFPEIIYNEDFMRVVIKTEKLLKKGAWQPTLDKDTVNTLGKTLNGQEILPFGQRSTINDVVVSALLLTYMHATCDTIGDEKLDLMMKAMSEIMKIKTDLEGDVNDVIDFMHFLYMYITFFSKYYKWIWNANIQKDDGAGGDINNYEIERAIGLKVLEDALRAIVDFGMDPRPIKDEDIQTQFGNEMKDVLSDERKQAERLPKRKLALMKILGGLSKSCRDNTPNIFTAVLNEGKTAERRELYNLQVLMMKAMVDAIIEWNPARGKGDKGDSTHLLRRKMTARGTYPWKPDESIIVTKSDNRDVIQVAKVIPLTAGLQRNEPLSYEFFAVQRASSLHEVLESGFVSKTASKPTKSEGERKKILAQFFELRSANTGTGEKRKMDNSKKDGHLKEGETLELGANLINDEAEEVGHKSKKQRREGATDNRDNSEEEEDSEEEDDEMEVDTQTANATTTTKHAVTLCETTTAATENVGQGAEGSDGENKTDTAVIMSWLMDVPKSRRAELMKQIEQMIKDSKAEMDDNTTTEKGGEEPAANNENNQTNDDSDDDNSWTENVDDASDVDQQLTMMGLKKSKDSIVNWADHVWTSSLENEIKSRTSKKAMKDLLKETNNVTEDNKGIQSYVNAARAKGFELTITVFYNGSDNKLGECTIKPEPGSEGVKVKRDIEIKLYREIIWKGVNGRDKQQEQLIVGYYQLEQNDCGKE